jgi:N-methylhydantoinase B
VAVLDKAVHRILEVHPPAELRPGDVFLVNDPYRGGVTHLNDVVVALPVLVDGELVAWTANIAHWNDVGGMAPGSISTEARELFQEGLRLPPVRVLSAGQPIRSVLEILRCNSRLPDYLLGDLWSALAAARVGERRLVALVERYGAEVYRAALTQLFDRGEQAARHALAALPHGTFTLAEEQDSGTIYRVAIEVSGDAFVVDLRDNPDQDEGPNNVSRDGATIAAQMALMNLVGGHVAANAGHFRVLRVLTRPGSVFDPAPPAACGLYYEVRIRLYDLILHCLATRVDDRLPAGSFGSICGTFIGGRHPDTGRHFTIVEPQVGGWGAARGRDGSSALFSPVHGDTFNCPAEVAEARYGLYVEQQALNEEPGGGGEWQGGRGVVVDYRVRSDDCFLTCAYTRSRYPAWSLAGGAEGSPNYVEVLRADGGRERFARVTGLELRTGDVVRIRTGSGGGYGEPR